MEGNTLYGQAGGGVLGDSFPYKREGEGEGERREAVKEGGMYSRRTSKEIKPASRF